MSNVCRFAAAVLAVTAIGGRPGAARAQTPAAALDSARAQIEKLNVDAAALLLRRVNDPAARATPGQRALARILGGVGELLQGREPRARVAFHEALGLDPLVRVDSLSFLHSDLVRVFEDVRAGPAALVVLLPADTVIPAESGVLRIGIRTSRRVPLTAAIVPEGAALEPAVYRDSQSVGGTGEFEWRLAGAGPVAPGTFTLQVTARDPGAATTFSATLRVERVAVDTEPIPSALDPATLLAESLEVRVRRPRALLTGLAFGAAAATLATLGPDGSGSGSDVRAVVVGGAISLGGIAGFLRRGTATRPISRNVAANRAAQAANAAARDSVAQSNARRRTRAGVRIVVTSR